MTAPPMAFTVEESYDRDYASDGRSRFGAYLRQNSSMFDYGDGMTTDCYRFALAAWRIAQSPIMAPGYVRPHPRIHGSDAHWDDDGRAAVTVYLAAPLPRAVARSLPRQPWWRGWEHAGYHDDWVEPWDNDQPAAFTTVTLRIPLTHATLPTPRYRAGVANTATAKQAVYAIRDLLNDTLRPVLAELGT